MPLNQDLAARVYTSIIDNRSANGPGMEWILEWILAKDSVDISHISSCAIPTEERTVLVLCNPSLEVLEMLQQN